MRPFFFFAALLLAAPSVVAQPVAPPPKLEPVPEPPPPVGLDTEAPTPGPTITPGSKVEEFTTPDGKKTIHVTEPNGWEYFLVEDSPGQPSGARTTNDDTGVRPPMWVILQW
jgi:hypothetical protein